LNWYEKIRKESASFDANALKDLKDRNELNKRIRKFKVIVKRLVFLQKAIAQNPPGAQKALQSIADDKMLTSFPEYDAMLHSAISVARDNYNTFAEHCEYMIEKIHREIKELEHIRSEFVGRVLPQRKREKRKK
jgi:hypothetical protein